MQLGDCVSGGEIGRDVTFQEDPSPDRQQHAILLAFRLRRVGLLMVGDKVAGTVIISDHQFNYDAAIAATCPPASNLPPTLSMQGSCAWHEYPCAPCGP